MKALTRSVARSANTEAKAPFVPAPVGEVRGPLYSSHGGVVKTYFYVQGRGLVQRIVSSRRALECHERAQGVISD